jgi:preprotein translocase subunit Sss1
VIDALEQLVQRILDILTVFVMPDWGELIGLIPIFLLIGVVGPILSLLAIGWILYLLRAPRPKVSLEIGPVHAQIVDGVADYPAGEPYCPVDQLIFPFGAITCDTCRRDLFVRCPKCSTGRAAHLSTCGNCGLVLRIENRARALRPAGPPPGGAAAA